jgi:cobalt-precorrin-5B (C1)-methyltransferase
MIDILKKHSIVKNVFNSIAERIKEICTDRFKIDFDVIIVNMEGQVLNNNYKSITIPNPE